MPAKGPSFSTAVIGLGGIGFRNGRSESGMGRLNHVDAILATEGLSLVGVADSDENVLQEACSMLGVPAFSSYNDMMERVRPDVVTVATPDPTHPHILQDLLRHGPRTVFCEKPLITTARQDAESLVRQYEEKGVGLMVNYSRRFITAYRELKTLLDAEGPGSVQSFLVYYSRGFRHNASHYLDLILWWFGEPEQVLVESRRKGLLDDQTLNVVLRYGHGLEARLAGLDIRNTIINEIDMVGTTLRVRIDTEGNMTFHRPRALPGYPGFTHLAPETTVDIGLGSALPNAYSNIIGWLHRREGLLSPARDSVALHKLMDRIEDSCTRMEGSLSNA